MAEGVPHAVWEFDKKIPIAIIMAIVSQFALSIWYASKIDSRVSLLETEFISSIDQIRKLNDSRELAAIAQTRQEDKTEQVLSIVQNLMQRSDYLHPELNNGKKTSIPERIH